MPILWCNSILHREPRTALHPNSKQLLKPTKKIPMTHSLSPRKVHLVGSRILRAAQGPSPHADGALRKDRRRPVGPFPHGAGRVQGRPRHPLQDPAGVRAEDGRVLRRDRAARRRRVARARERLRDSVERGPKGSPGLRSFQKNAAGAGKSADRRIRSRKKSLEFDRGFPENRWDCSQIHERAPKAPRIPPQDRPRSDLVRRLRTRAHALRRRPRPRPFLEGPRPRGSLHLQPGHDPDRARSPGFRPLATQGNPDAQPG